jgi:PAS domain S-box-containing protein
MSIRYKILIWLLIVGITPGLLISFLFYKNNKEVTEKLEILKLIAVADMQKKDIEIWLREKISVLQIMADDQDLERFLTDHRDGVTVSVNGIEQAIEPGHVLTTLSNLKANFDYYKVYLTDFSGTVLASTNSLDNGKIINESLIDKTILDNGLYIKDAYSSKDGIVLISFATPVYASHQTLTVDKNSQPVGVLVFELEVIKNLLKLTKQSSVLKGSGEVIIGRKKLESVEFITPLAHNHDELSIASDQVLLSKDFAVLMNLATRGNEGVIRGLDYRGVEVISAYRYIPIMDWGFVLKEDTYEAFASVDSLRDKIIIISLLFITFFGLLARFISRQITSKIVLLRSDVEKVQKGNLDYKINIESKDEIGQLALAFDKLLQYVKKSRVDVDKQVLAQTQQLVVQSEKLNVRQKAMLNVIGDIEVEKENALRERDKINIILQSIGDGVFVLDHNYKIIVFNESAEVISGFSEKEAVGKVYTDILKFTFQVNGEVNNKFIINAVEKGKMSRMANHTILTQKNGKQIMIADSAAPIKDKEGNILGCVVVFRDATNEVEVDRMKTEFVSLASHQLNTPLTGIKWFLELLLKGKAGKLNKEQTEFLQNIEFSNNRMIGLVNDLLNISRIESGSKFVIEKQNKDIIKTLKGSTSRYNQLALKKKVKVVIAETVPAKKMIEIDESKIDQVFGNLISNAIKYSRPETEIKIGFKETPKEIIFSFKNSGLGIPVSQQKRIFEKFFRADNIMTTDTDGNGLGLYIVKSIIEGHGGRVWFKSIESETTTFYVSLPKG